MSLCRHNEPPSTVRRRRVIVAIVLVLGAAALSLALRRHPGEPAFYWWSLALAGAWALGAFASGPLHLGGARWRGRNQRPVVSGTVIGLLLGGAFVVGGLIVREIPPVAELITRLLRYTDEGSWRLTMAVALLAAIGEEMFYRGALYTALGRHHPLLISTAIYAIATLASSRNPMLAFAAIILGTVCALERRATRFSRSSPDEPRPPGQPGADTVPAPHPPARTAHAGSARPGDRARTHRLPP
jgi:membrane protease YdiL (CAAX protease family)